MTRGILAALVAALSVLLGASSAGAALADASVFVSPTGNDANACTQTAPCKTLARGFTVAASGATVQLADGYYGCQAISGVKSSTVTFVPAVGAVPKVTCQLTIGATNVAFRDMQIAGIRSTSAKYVTLNNVDVTCQDTAPYQLWGGKCSAGLFLFAPTNHFHMIGGSVGPTWDDSYDQAPGQSQVGINLTAGSTAISSNLEFDGVRFHDNRRIDDQQHTSCLMVGGGDIVAIRNGRFQNCAVFDLFFTWWHFGGLTYPPGKHITVSGNVFDKSVAGCSGCPTGFFSIDWASYPPVWDSVLVKGNKFGQSMGFDTDANVSNFAVTGNSGVQLSYGCKSGVAYSYNLWDNGVKCGPTDGTTDPGSTTTTPPPEPTPTPTPTPTPGGYAPACAPTCDEQIATLTSQLAAANARLAALEAQLAAANGTITTLQDKIAAAVAALAP